MDRLDAQLLLLHALGRQAGDRAWLIAHDTDDLPRLAADRFEALVRRRRDGEPLAYITGVKEFHGLELTVDARVLVPRPDTETLVNWALDLLDRPEACARTLPCSVLDLGTGSGAVALALKAARPALDVTATDASFDALAVAQANARRLGLALEFAQGSWFDAAQGRYHLIVSNPPYVAQHDAHLAALRHEPRSALVSGPDGLDDLRQIVEHAPGHLHPGGWLLLEHGWDQAAAVRTLLAAAALEQVQSRPDLAGMERCSGGRMPPDRRADERIGGETRPALRR
ncbi:MAG: Peptide chain release factor N(5)-glutamine methyltransferase [Burkholderiaceae bacterium]|nr:MAG: Peptide chain release factor N(5)-glutamine methyltransferase [Burkholderiaceae bacterium]